MDESAEELEKRRKPVAVKATEYLLKLDRRHAAERLALERTLAGKYGRQAAAVLQKIGVSPAELQTAERPALAAAARLIARFPPKAQASLVRGLREETKAAILRNLLSFEALANMDRISIQHVLRAIPRDVLARAIAGAPEELSKLAFDNLSTGAAAVLRDEIEYAGETSDADVEVARERIGTIMIELYSEGRIPLPNQP